MDLHKRWTPEAAATWLNEHSSYFASIVSKDNRRAIAILVANVWNTYGLQPLVGSERGQEGDEPHLAYESGFACLELRKEKPGFRLLVRGPKPAYAGVVPDEYFVKPRGGMPRIEVNRPMDDVDVAWAAIQRAAELDRLPVRKAPSTSLLDRITINPEICGGRPCIRGLRVRVTDVLEMLAGGASESEILEDYPYLEREDIMASLEFAARWLDHPVLRAS